MPERFGRERREQLIQFTTINMTLAEIIRVSSNQTAQNSECRRLHMQKLGEVLLEHALPGHITDLDLENNMKMKVSRSI